MYFQDVATFVVSHWLGVGMPGLALVMLILWLLHYRCGIYTWYGVILVAIFLWATASQHLLYFYVFLLGFITAFTEILGKFRDEPLKVLQTGQCLIYHVFNGFIAMLALYLLQVFDMTSPLDTEDGQVKAVFLAGLEQWLLCVRSSSRRKLGMRRWRWPRTGDQSLFQLHG